MKGLIHICWSAGINHASMTADNSEYFRKLKLKITVVTFIEYNDSDK